MGGVVGCVVLEKVFFLVLFGSGLLVSSVLSLVFRDFDLVVVCVLCRFFVVGVVVVVNVGLFDMLVCVVGKVGLILVGVGGCGGLMLLCVIILVVRWWV